MYTTADIAHMAASSADGTNVSAFLRHQRGKAFSPRTIKRRRSVLLRFISSIEPLRLFEVTPDLIDDWLFRFKSPATRHAYRSDLVAFYEWAVRRQISPRNPAAETDSIRCPKPLPRPLDTRDVPRIIAAATEPIDLWCALAAYAGLRVSEIANIAREDITTHGTNPTVVVRNGKGAKDRIIPLHPVIASMIEPYRRAGPLFAEEGDQVGRKGADHIRSCGIDGTMHQLRHTFGTELARASKGNVVLVAYLMGHASINTSQRYIGWSGGESSDVIASMYRPDGTAA